jgi:phage regulator Rha-like protein
MDQSQALVVLDEENVPLADSRLIALKLGMKPLSFRRLLEEKQDYVEKHFGVIAFMEQKPLPGSTGGRPEKYAMLTEEQSYYALTFCENTHKAMELRAKLVKEFMAAKQQLIQLFDIEQAITQAKEYISTLRELRRLQRGKSRLKAIKAPKEPRKVSEEQIEDLLIHFLKKERDVTVRQIVQLGPPALRKLKTSGVRNLLLGLEQSDVVLVSRMGKKECYALTPELVS